MQRKGRIQIGIYRRQARLGRRKHRAPPSCVRLAHANRIISLSGLLPLAAGKKLRDGCNNYRITDLSQGCQGSIRSTSTRYRVHARTGAGARKWVIADKRALYTWPAARARYATGKPAAACRFARALGTVVVYLARPEIMRPDELCAPARRTCPGRFLPAASGSHAWTPFILRAGRLPVLRLSGVAKTHLAGRHTHIPRGVSRGAVGGCVPALL